MLVFIGKLLLSDEYPYARVSVIFASFCTGQISHQQHKGLTDLASEDLSKLSFLLPSGAKTWSDISQQYFGKYLTESYSLVLKKHFSIIFQILLLFDVENWKRTEILAYGYSHLRVLTESYPLNTNMTGFRWFPKKKVSLCAGRK